MVLCFRENEKMKSALIEALTTKGTALIETLFAQLPDGEVPPSLIKSRPSQPVLTAKTSISNEKSPAPVENGDREKSVDAPSESEPSEMNGKTDDSKSDEISVKMVDEVFVELVKFVDPSDSKVGVLIIDRMDCGSSFRLRNAFAFSGRNVLR